MVHFHKDVFTRSLCRFPCHSGPLTQFAITRFCPRPGGVVIEKPECMKLITTNMQTKFQRDIPIFWAVNRVTYPKPILMASSLEDFLAYLDVAHK